MQGFSNQFQNRTNSHLPTTKKPSIYYSPKSQTMEFGSIIIHSGKQIPMRQKTTTPKHHQNKSLMSPHLQNRNQRIKYLHTQFKTLKDRIKFVQQRNARKIQQIGSKFQRYDQSITYSHNQIESSADNFSQEDKQVIGQHLAFLGVQDNHRNNQIMSLKIERDKMTGKPKRYNSQILQRTLPHIEQANSPYSSQQHLPQLPVHILDKKSKSKSIQGLCRVDLMIHKSPSPIHAQQNYFQQQIHSQLQLSKDSMKHIITQFWRHISHNYKLLQQETTSLNKKLINLDLQTQELKQCFNHTLSSVKEEREVNLIKVRQYQFIIKQHKDKIQNTQLTRSALQADHSKFRQQYFKEKSQNAKRINELQIQRDNARSRNNLLQIRMGQKQEQIIQMNHLIMTLNKKVNQLNKKSDQQPSSKFPQIEGNGIGSQKSLEERITGMNQKSAKQSVQNILLPSLSSHNIINTEMVSKKAITEAQPSPQSDRLIYQLQQKVLTLSQSLLKMQQQNRQYQKLTKQKESNSQRLKSQLQDSQYRQSKLKQLYEQIQRESTTLQQISNKKQIQAIQNFYKTINQYKRKLKENDHYKTTVVNCLMQIEKQLPKKIRKQFELQKNNKNRTDKTQVLFKQLGAFIQYFYHEQETLIKLLKQLFDVQKIQYEIQGKQVTIKKINQKLTRLTSRQRQLKEQNKQLKKQVQALNQELIQAKTRKNIKKKPAGRQKNNAMDLKCSLNYLQSGSYQQANQDLGFAVQKLSEQSFGNKQMHNPTIQRPYKGVTMKDEDQNKQKFINFLKNQLQLKNKQIHQYEAQTSEKFDENKQLILCYQTRLSQLENQKKRLLKKIQQLQQQDINSLQCKQKQLKKQISKYQEQQAIDQSQRLQLKSQINCLQLGIKRLQHQRKSTQENLQVQCSGLSKKYQKLKEHFTETQKSQKSSSQIKLRAFNQLLEQKGKLIVQNKILTERANFLHMTQTMHKQEREQRQTEQKEKRQTEQKATQQSNKHNEQAAQQIKLHSEREVQRLNQRVKELTEQLQHTRSKNLHSLSELQAQIEKNRTERGQAEAQLNADRSSLRQQVQQLKTQRKNCQQDNQKTCQTQKKQLKKSLRLNKQSSDQIQKLRQILKQVKLKQRDSQCRLSQSVKQKEQILKINGKQECQIQRLEGLEQQLSVGIKQIQAKNEEITELKKQLNKLQRDSASQVQSLQNETRQPKDKFLVKQKQITDLIQKNRASKQQINQQVNKTVSQTSNTAKSNQNVTIIMSQLQKLKEQNLNLKMQLQTLQKQFQSLIEQKQQEQQQSQRQFMNQSDIYKQEIHKLKNQADKLKSSVESLRKLINKILEVSYQINKQSQVDDLADCFQHILNICDVKDKLQIDKMSSYIDSYVKMQQMLKKAQKIMGGEKQNKKGWF